MLQIMPVCQETAAASLTSTALPVQGDTPQFSYSFLRFFFFVSVVPCQMPVSIYHKNQHTNTPPNTLQPSINIYTFTRAFYKPLLTHRRPSIAHTHISYTLSLLVYIYTHMKVSQHIHSLSSFTHSRQTSGTHTSPPNI